MKRDALLLAGCPVLRRWQVFCRTVGKPFGVSFPMPTPSGRTAQDRLSWLKSFCELGLQTPSLHPWHELMKQARLSSDGRRSVFMSLFLFRKVLPSPRPDLASYAKKMSEPSPQPDEGFLRYVRKTVPKLFPPGWDLTLYPNACLSATLPIKSCRTRGLAEGGSRAEYLLNGVPFSDLSEFDASPEELSRAIQKANAVAGWTRHQVFVLEALTRESPIDICPSRLRSVETGGKWRTISVGDVNCNLARPLHTAIYNHISRFKWLLRGDAKPRRFAEFSPQPGQVFVSGDYESATDNLNGWVQRELLDLIINQATQIPRGIADLGRQLLRTPMQWEDDGPVVYQERGQLMGNLVSFPLLCLVNYLAFRYFSGSSGPVRINGDDIVFRGTPAEYERWREGVGRSGLVLSPGKTMVDRRYFSLNSSLFKAFDRRVDIVPCIRSSAFGLRADCGGVETLRGRYSSFCPGFFGSRRSLLRIEFLKWNAKYILSSDRSVSRGLGLPVYRHELIHSHLWDREAHYLSMESERPLPVSKGHLEQDKVPEGWELLEVDKLTKKMRENLRLIGPEFIACAWSDPKRVGGLDKFDYKTEVVRTGSGPFLGHCRRPLRCLAALLGLSPANTRRYLTPKVRRPVEYWWRRNRIRVWQPVSPVCPVTESRPEARVHMGLEECPVCYEASVTRVTTCGHGFCRECSGAWFVHEKTSCPCCRREVIPPVGRFSRVAPPDFVSSIVVAQSADYTGLGTQLAAVHSVAGEGFGPHSSETAALGRRIFRDSIAFVSGGFLDNCSRVEPGGGHPIKVQGVHLS